MYLFIRFFFFFRDAVILSCANCFTSFFSGFVIFSVLGFMALTLQTTVATVATSGEQYCILLTILVKRPSPVSCISITGNMQM